MLKTLTDAGDHFGLYTYQSHGGAWPQDLHMTLKQATLFLTLFPYLSDRDQLPHLMSLTQGAGVRSPWEAYNPSTWKGVQGVPMDGFPVWAPRVTG